MKNLIQTQLLAGPHITENEYMKPYAKDENHVSSFDLNTDMNMVLTPLNANSNN
jgi:hypothetical protein